MEYVRVQFSSPDPHGKYILVMTTEQQARAFWYNRMMNVTARGYRPQVAGYAREKSAWRVVFDPTSCPSDFGTLLSTSMPTPTWVRNPSNPDYGTWGNVSIWKKFKEDGYENYVKYGRADETVLDFKYCTYENGVIHEDPDHCFYATFVKNTDDPYVKWKGCIWEIDEDASSPEYIELFEELLETYNPVPKFYKNTVDIRGNVKWSYVNMWKAATAESPAISFQNQYVESSPDATELRFAFFVYVNDQIQSGKVIYATAKKISVNPWTWTAVRDCPAKLIEELNSDNAPYLTFRKDSAARSPYNGFWTLDEIRYDSWSFNIWLTYGYGNETTVQLTELGFHNGNPNPDVRAVVCATRKNDI